MAIQTPVRLSSKVLTSFSFSQRFLEGEGTFWKGVPTDLPPTGPGHLWVTNYRLIYFALAVRKSRFFDLAFY